MRATNPDMKNQKFIDSAVLYARSGNGGDGSASFRREKFVPRGGPDGGDGGRGGHVILEANKDVDSLVKIFFAPHQRAEHGGRGSGKKSHGRNGKDLIITVPLGTNVIGRDTGETLGDLIIHGEQLTVVGGGKGGRGNVHWKSSTHQAPTEFTPGIPGKELEVRLELKILADIGLVGFPNAGKSSLLTCLSDAHPKVASYPFTTLNPIIGTLVFEDYTRMTIADIPGLIEGAHDGVGLGHSFLKHIERASFLVYVIDMAAVDTRKPHEDFEALKNELFLHDNSLKDRPYLVVANKMDLSEANEYLGEFKKATGITPLEVSAETGEGVQELKRAIHEITAEGSEH
jgi:GTP-binding protein